MKYRVLVTGCRDWEDEEEVCLCLDMLEAKHGEITVVCGDCKTGADKMTRLWVEVDHGRGRELYVFQADWSGGKKGGPERNQRMVDRGGAKECLAFWDGKSRGTLDCLSRAVRAGIPVRIIPA